MYFIYFVSSLISIRKDCKKFLKTSTCAGFQEPLIVIKNLIFGIGWEPAP